MKVLNLNIYKSNNKSVEGVCSGISEYIGINPIIIRVLFIILSLYNFVFVIGYVLLSLMLEECPVKDSLNSGKK